LLAPLLAVLLLAALNPGPLVTVRLLTSRSPAVPLGVWLAGGGAGGALISGLATALALREGRRRSTVVSSAANQEAWEPWVAAGSPTSRNPAEAGEASGPRRPAAEPESWPAPGPERAPGEPPPTVSVPFRVLRRPQSGTGPVSGWSGRAAEQSMPSGTAASTVAAAPGPDDWDSVGEEDW
jgi:hypothetical protein